MTYDLSYTDMFGNDLCERYSVDYTQGLSALMERLNELSRNGIVFYICPKPWTAKYFQPC